ncbi:hypothetical protein TNCV_4917961 [Trichonephila clavipes]|nr:hypothetical protein TNCV_4917961 [Trichonephila clavipes]
MLSPEERVAMSRDLIGMTDENDAFLKKFVTGNESWCFLSIPQTKRQSTERNQKHPQGMNNFDWTKAERNYDEATEGPLKNLTQECF